MACCSPLFRVPFTSENFKLLLPMDQKRLKNHGVFLKPYALLSYSDLPGWNSDAVQMLRCGQCTDCRLKYSRDWAIRCSLEASLHKFNYFVTLTYDDDHLPSGSYVDYTGEVFNSTLLRRDVQLFVKNLREWERTANGVTNIKVFYCGEYGSLTSRPHYHLCLFGVSEIPDLQFGFKKASFTYYKSAKYQSFWSDEYKIPRGFVDISEVSFDSIAYTARYCLKKQQGKMKKDFIEYYDTLDPLERPDLRLQPFVGMSLKPGIAASYFEDNKLQITSEDLVKYQKNFDLYKSKPPRYFDKLFDREDPAAFKRLVARRTDAALHSQRFKAQMYSEPFFERLRREGDILNAKVDKYVTRDL